MISNSSGNSTSTFPDRPPLFGLTENQIARELALSLPALTRYRASQVARFLYRKGAASFQEMTNLPAQLRLDLEARYRITAEVIDQVEESRDGSRKYRIGLRDGSAVEAVFMETKGKRAFCLSSQAGCAMGCRFCRTGEMGLSRNLTASEILGQLALLRQREGTAPARYLFMGMGEPLHNTGALVPAIRFMTDPLGLGISPRRITVSTVGYTPGFRAIAPLSVKLTLSLSAATDELRNRLIPVNRRHPIRHVLSEACRSLGRRGDRLTVAYVLLRGVNDGLDQADALARMLASRPVKVNLIPFNPYPGSPFAMPEERKVRQFQERLLAASIATSIRRSRGADALAACGQLATDQEHPPDRNQATSPPLLRPAESVPSDQKTATKREEPA